VDEPRDHRWSMPVTARPNIKRWIAFHAFHLAVADIGKGEEGANNAGAWLTQHVRPHDGTGGPSDTGGAWCASWVSYCYTRALSAAEAYFGLPGLQLGFKTSRGALRLGERMAGAAWVVQAQYAREGDVFFRERDGGGHTGFVRGPAIDGKLPTLEGNVGKFPALVKPLHQNPQKSGLYVLRYA